MKRRAAIKSLTVTVAGVVFLPGCDFSSSGAPKNAQSFLSGNQNKLLSEIVESIIPATADIPGAKALGVHDYVKLMIADCHKKEVHTIFRQGLETVEKLPRQIYGKSYATLSPNQKADIFASLEASEEEKDQQFYTLVKGLSIQGFMTSQYIMTNHADYQMMPGPAYGCIPVSSKQKT